jgi:DNA polymerase III subunit delta
VAALKPAYLVCGDDDAKIDAWRARVRRRAEEEGGPGALEAYDGSQHDPAEVAAALATLTFSTGDRYVMADGVEAWKAGDLEPLEQALAAGAPDTVLVLIARGKAPDRLAKAVEQAGGERREYSAPKPWEMPKWVAERAQEEGLRLDPEAAKALVGAVGTRQQRLAREIEKLSLLAHPEQQLTAEEVERLASGEASRQAYDLADALVAGDAPRAVRIAEELTAREDRPSKLVWPVVQRLREVHRAAELLDSGVPEKGIAGELKLPPWKAKRAVGHAKRADRDALGRALCAFASLEIELRGGGTGLDEETAFSLTLARAAA